MDSHPLALRVHEAAAQAAAAQAHLVEVAAAYRETPQGWAYGWRSFQQWLTIETGLDYHSASEIVRVGKALPDLPETRAAFQEGRLSYDKVRMATRVATPDDERIWLELALGYSAGQFSRLVQSYQQARRLNDPAAQRDASRRRGLWAYWKDDGLVELRAILPREDAALVLATLERAARPAYDDSVAPADEPAAARRADALVDLCERAPLDRANVPALVVHVDIGVLTGEDPDGRCETEDGRPLSREAALRLGCNAQIVAITEKDGLPIDVARARRTESAPLRRARIARDRYCRVPGCRVKASCTSGHHLLHWALGGPTILGNETSLCGFHHRAYHRGDLVIERNQAGELEFRDRHGNPIRPPEPCAVRRRTHRTTGTPQALWGGGRMDLDYTVSVVCDAIALLERRKAKPPG